MYIAEFTLPGSRVNDPDLDWSRRVQRIVSATTDAIGEVAISLMLFEEASRSCDSLDSDRDAELARRKQISNELLKAHRAEMTKHKQIIMLAEITAKRESWAQGRLPRSYKMRLPTIHARSFVFSLHRAISHLSQLADDPKAPPAVASAVQQFDHAVPHLTDIRNSIAHFDERNLAQSYGKPIALKPILNPLINAPQGKALMLECLIGDRFGITANDGHYYEVVISAATLQLAKKSVQDSINALSWEGHPKHLP